MTSYTNCLAAAAAIAGLAAPASAQYTPYPQQTYPYGYTQGYGANNSGYTQGYGANPVGQIIDQLLGNRYNVSDRQAVSRCASAAMSEASAQYRGYNRGYDNGYNNGYGSGYNNGSRQAYSGAMQVTAITDVQRRSNGLRVSGLMSSGSGYGGQYGYQNGGYARGNVSFRCNVDYRGEVTNIRIGRNRGYRG